jgi:hypothetical protein
MVTWVLLRVSTLGEMRRVGNSTVQILTIGRHGVYSFSHQRQLSVECLKVQVAYITLYFKKSYDEFINFVRLAVSTA